MNGTISDVYGFIEGIGNVSGFGSFVDVGFVSKNKQGISVIGISDVGVTNETSYVNIDTQNSSVNVNYWVVEDGVVYANNSRFYASCDPAVLNSRGWAEFNFRSKKYDGDVDFIWGFNTSNVKPKRPVQIWREYLHHNYTMGIVEDYGSFDILNVSSYTNLGIENYDSYNVFWGTKNNSYLFNVTFNDGVMENSWVFAFSDYQEQGNNYRLWGNYNRSVKVWTNETYLDWQDIEIDYNKISYDFRGMSTWYLVKNQPIITGKDYRIRYYIDIPFGGLNGCSGKYWWAFKPSSESLHEAIQNEHLFYLDPWWNSDWDYSKKITINASEVEEDCTYFPVLISLSSDSDLSSNAQSDGGDIAFVNSDNTTQYAHEIERYNSATGELIAWVNVTSLSSSSNTIMYMYYGNAGASNQTDVSNTWNESYVNVQHMVGSGTSSDSSQNSIDFTNSGTISNSSSWIGSGRTWNDDSDYLYNNDAYLNPGWENRTISYWMYSTNTNNNWIVVDYGSGSDEWDINGYSQHEFLRILKTNPGYRYMDTTVRDGSWHYVCWVIDRPSGWIDAYRDGSLNNGAGDSISDVGKVTSSANTEIGRHVKLGLTMDMDEFRIYKYMRSANWIKTEYNNQNDPDGFFFLGDEIEQPPEEADRETVSPFNYWFTCGNTTTRKGTNVFNYWFDCGNETTRTGTKVFDYYFICGNATTRSSTNIFNYWFDCGNSTTRSATSPFNYYFVCGNNTVRSSTEVLDYYFVCGNSTPRSATVVFNNWFTCGNTTNRNAISIFDYYFICGNVTSRQQTGIFDYYFICGNSTTRKGTNIFDYWFLCRNASLRTGTNVFNYWFTCGNSTPRQGTNVFDYWFTCGNSTPRSSTNIFDYYFVCGNTTSRSAINVFDYWFTCGNASLRTGTKIFDYYFNCGNSSTRTGTNVFNYWFLCGNVTPRSATVVFDYWFVCGNATRTATLDFDYWFLCGNVSPLAENITITNIYPSNNSINIPLQPYVYATFNSTLGNTMNISWYNDTVLIASDNNVNNGTHNELFLVATSTTSLYVLNISVNDGEGNWANETVYFTTEGTGVGGGVTMIGDSNRGVIFVFSIIGFIGILGLLGIRRRKRNNGGNVRYGRRY